MNNKQQSLWVKLACDYFDDERILLVGAEAELLFVRGLAWAKRENDGRVGRGALVRLQMGLQTPVESVLRLVEVGLWVDVADGYEIANWDAWQAPNNHTGKRAEAGALGNHRRWHIANPSPDCRYCIANASQSDGNGIALGIQEKEKEKENLTRRSATSVDDDFADWWRTWPKKVARGSAARAYAKARKTTDAATLLAGAERVAADWATMEPDRRQFVPYPASWLNAERWDDAVTEVGPPPSPPTWFADEACQLCEGFGWRTVDEATNTFGPCECRSTR